MAGAHWYPSLTKLGNGDIWSAGGLDDKAQGTVLTEMFDTSAMRWLLQTRCRRLSFWGTYPHMFLLDDGKMFLHRGHTFGTDCLAAAPRSMTGAPPRCGMCPVCGKRT